VHRSRLERVGARPAVQEVAEPADEAAAELQEGLGVEHRDRGLYRLQQLAGAEDVQTSSTRF